MENCSDLNSNEYKEYKIAYEKSEDLLRNFKIPSRELYSESVNLFSQIHSIKTSIQFFTQVLYES